MNLKPIITPITWISPLLLFTPLFLLSLSDRIEYGKYIGSISVILFAILLLPGIVKRLDLIKQFSIVPKTLLPIRRQLGILMFLTAFTHYLSLKVIPTIQFSLPPSLPIYQAFGLFTLFCALLLFLTSNNWSTKKLKTRWNTLHKLVYIMVWTLFFHIALQGINWQSILIGVIAVLEASSLIYARFKTVK